MSSSLVSVMLLAKYCNKIRVPPYVLNVVHGKRDTVNFSVVIRLFKRFRSSVHIALAKYILQNRWSMENVFK